MPGSQTIVQRVAYAPAALGVLLFWLGIVLAAQRYPSEYDWRYMTVSRLLGAENDPAGYLWARAGIALCGLFGYVWATLLAQRRRDLGMREHSGAIRVLQVGYFFMACAAVLPESLLRVPKGHEMLAILAFVGIWCGIVSVMFQSFVQALLRRMRSATGRPRLYAAALVGAAMLPIVLAGAAQAYVYLEVPDLPWISLAWRARGVPVYISFAFWEWVTCLVLSAYMVILAVTTTRLKAA
jgi:hypothetical protein